MKKILYLRKTTAPTPIVLDPFFYVGKEFIFDDYYLIKVLSVRKNNFTVSIDIDNESAIDRIVINDFLNYLTRGTMIEKIPVGECSFVSFEEYHDLIATFLLINYNLLIISIEFDWQAEFEKRTPVEIACKIALGMMKK
jgi:hypothetical protein